MSNRTFFVLIGICLAIGLFIALKMLAIELQYY